MQSQNLISMRVKIYAGSCYADLHAGYGPLATEPKPYGKRPPLVEAFHTRVFGPIQNVHLARQMDAENAELNSLNIGTQFAMREGERWLRFWIPSIDQGE